MSNSKKDKLSKLVNPIAKRHSKMMYKHFLNLFISKGLISEPKYCRMNMEIKYPVLSSYNYFNDPKIYKSYRKKGEKIWNGRVLKEFLTKEDIKSWGEKGYEFRLQ
ncbi:hypothetical protein J4411_03980 [Candidatus Pacearchaeota archaeon]|nr:hypothetical protein [Candidatus Pacearchaeota archaeon]